MKPENSGGVSVRPAIRTDHARVLDLVPRLRAFGAVPLRSAHDLDAGECRTVNRYFESPPHGAQLWVAETSEGTVEGAVYAESVADYFTQERHGHVGILMVSEEAEGRGIARLLLDVVENWCRVSGFRLLTLNVFAGNSRARSFYERAAFRPDVLRYVKSLHTAAGNQMAPNTFC